MSAPTLPRPTPPASPPRVAPVASRRPPWVSSLTAGAAVLLAAAPVSAVVLGGAWLASAASAIAVVVGIGLGATALETTTRGTAARGTGAGARGTAVGVAVAQVVGLLMLLTVRFSDDGVVGVLPGSAALGDLGALLAGAAAQIDAGIAPVPDTPEILFLVTGALGLLAVAVHLAAVGAAAPAAAGVPLLAAFAVPAALADDLLPWWALAAAAAGLGLLLLQTPEGDLRRMPGGVALVAAAAAIALVVPTAFVGTSGRFDGGGTGGDGSGSIGLSPFTALRGQLDQSSPTPLFEVRGLERPGYLRALTLSEYRGGVGWQATRPGPGPAAAGPFERPAVPGTVADVRIDNIGFRDYWLPLYGSPLSVEGLAPDRWVLDEDAGTAYTTRPFAQESWRQQAFLPAPTPALLRAAEDGAGAPAATYSDVRGVDPRVAEIASEVTAGAGTDFDRALALQRYFTGPDSEFTYDLATAPPAGDDALVEFLTVGRVGYCEQFASAMAVMLRTVGVPARVAVGFTAGDAVADHRRISTADAHAWVEAWFPGVGWTVFDPTPLTDGRTVVPSYVEQALREAAGGETPVGQDTAAPLAPPPSAAGPEAAPPEPPAPTPGAPDPAGTGTALLPVLLLLLVAVVVPVPLLLRRHVRRTRLAEAAGGGPAAAGAAWRELLAESADRGTLTPPTDTVRGAARRLVREHRLDPEAQNALREVVSAVESSWYGDRHPAPHVLTAPVQAVRRGIASGTASTVRDRLLPRSVLRGLPGRRTRGAGPHGAATDDAAAASGG